MEDSERTKTGSGVRPRALRVRVLAPDPSRAEALREMLGNPSAGAFSVEASGPADVVLSVGRPDPPPGGEPLSGAPVVVVTDTEEAGLDAIRNGVSEFVLEADLTPAALRRALVCAVERRRATAQPPSPPALRDRDRRLRLLTEQVPAILWTTDKELRFTTSLGAGLTALGLKPNQVVGQTLFEFFGTTDREFSPIAAHLRALQGEDSVYEMMWDRQIYSCTVEPLHDKDDEVIGCLGLGLDVTETQRREAEIERLAKFPEENPSPVLRVSDEGVIAFANGAAKCVLDEWHVAEGDEAPEDVRSTIAAASATGYRREAEMAVGDRTFLLIFAPVTASGYTNIYGTEITERKRSAGKVKLAMDGTVQAIGRTTEIRDPYTAGHQQRVAQLACVMARRMGLPNHRVEGLRVAGVLHDIGKIAIPAEILSKPTSLTESEYALIRDHAQTAVAVLDGVHFPWPIRDMVLQHHERMDGSGYPLGLVGEAIILEARILAVADVVEAMASHRPYRPAVGMEAAMAEIRHGKGTLYDPQAVDACLGVFEDGFDFSR